MTKISHLDSLSKRDRGTQKWSIQVGQLQAQLESWTEGNSGQWLERDLHSETLNSSQLGVLKMNFHFRR